MALGRLQIRRIATRKEERAATGIFAEMPSGLRPESSRDSQKCWTVLMGNRQQRHDFKKAHTTQA
jgi:hypothetical protein